MLYRTKTVARRWENRADHYQDGMQFEVPRFEGNDLVGIRKFLCVTVELAKHGFTKLSAHSNWTRVAVWPALRVTPFSLPKMVRLSFFRAP